MPAMVRIVDMNDDDDTEDPREVDVSVDVVSFAMVTEDTDDYGMHGDFRRCSS